MGGKPWGGVLLTDRGQYPTLHAVGKAATYDYQGGNHAIVKDFDTAVAMCESDPAYCSYTFRTRAASWLGRFANGAPRLPLRGRRTHRISTK